MKVSKTNIDLSSLPQEDARCVEMEDALQAEAASSVGRSARHWTLQFQADGDKTGGSKTDEE